MSLVATLERAFPYSAAFGRGRAVLQFEKVLAESGIHAALRFMNARVRHRFTAVARFDPPVLRNLFVFDRRNPDVLFGGTSQELEATYAAIVMRRKQAFRTDNAQRDSRLTFNSLRGTMQSYAGVPIRLVASELWGVLAHYDEVTRVLPSGEMELLQEVIPGLARWLKPAGVALADTPAAL
jgi:GAF domain-containing protein